MDQSAIAIGKDQPLAEYFLNKKISGESSHSPN